MDVWWLQINICTSLVAVTKSDTNWILLMSFSTLLVGCTQQWVQKICLYLLWSSNRSDLHIVVAFVTICTTLVGPTSSIASRRSLNLKTASLYFLEQSIALIKKDLATNVAMMVINGRFTMSLHPCIQQSNQPSPLFVSSAHFAHYIGNLPF